MTLEEAKKEINKNQCSPTIACNRDYDSGWEDAIFKVIEILEQVDTVPVPKDTMTLTELARELRKIFPRTKYVTVGNNPHKATLLPEQKVVSLFYSKKNKKPAFVTEYIIPNIWGIRDDKLTVGKYPFYSLGIHEFYLGEVVTRPLRICRRERRDRLFTLYCGGSR